MTDFRLVKAGYGDIEMVRRLDARTYLQALYYEQFCSEYEETALEMMTDENR